MDLTDVDGCDVDRHPPIGTVGLTEEEARTKYVSDSIKIYKSSFRAMYFSMVDEHSKEPSVFKLVVTGEEERVRQDLVDVGNSVSSI